MLEIGIESSILNEIIDGRKTIEGRLGKAKFLTLREGYTLRLREDVWRDGEIVESLPDRAKVKITQILYFEDFNEMLRAVDFKQVIPAAQNVDEALAAYRQFYTDKDEKEYGVVAFIFKLI